VLEVPDAATMPADVCLRFLREAKRLHEAGLQSYGLLVAPADAPDGPFRATDVVFLDAGFVADPADLLRAYRRIEDAGQEIVAMFHSHRRQPPNFSWIDFRLHNPAFQWHLIVSFRRGPTPLLQAFRVAKEGTQMGIGPEEDREGSELTYPGPEVAPLSLSVDGLAADVAACVELAGFGRRIPMLPGK
jgi:proteasome lid subunit RPN8/RPN11